MKPPFLTPGLAVIPKGKPGSEHKKASREREGSQCSDTNFRVPKRCSQAQPQSLLSAVPGLSTKCTRKPKLHPEFRHSLTLSPSPVIAPPPPNGIIVSSTSSVHRQGSLARLCLHRFSLKCLGSCPWATLALSHPTLAIRPSLCSETSGHTTRFQAKV